MTERVLVVAPVGRDAALIESVLSRAGLEVRICRGVEALAQEARNGAGALLIADEALHVHGYTVLADALRDEPPWSAIPVVVLTRGRRLGRQALLALEPLRVLRPVTFLARPVRVVTLASTLRVAIDARRRQYAMRGLLDRLEHGVRSRDEFLAMFGHEIRNPLSAVVSALELMRHLPHDHPRVVRAAAIVDRQVRHLVQLTDDLLDVSRVTRGKVTLRIVPVAVAQALADALDDVEALARQRRIAIEMPAVPDGLSVDADALRLRQILINLLGNAVKYTPPGGRVCVDVATMDESVVLRVRDTGIGMSEEMLATVFEMFVQGRRTPDRSEGGLGIGLTLTRSLVELHGGTITAASDGPGRGSTFTVVLPRTAEEGVVRAAAAPGPPPTVAGVRILLVDDNEDLVEALGTLLERWGYDVQVAHDGESALERARAFQPDAILLDVGLPKLDGCTVARRLRALPEFRTTPLIALTGYGQEGDRRSVSEAGFDRHLTKPVEVGQLHAILASLAG